MTRSAAVRLADILAACDAIDVYASGDPELTEGLVFDAVRMRLVEIGEAVKDLESTIVDRAPHVPWAQIARMRDVVAHRYFDTTHAIIVATVRHDIPVLRRAAEGLLAEL